MASTVTIGMCGFCYDDNVEIFDPVCAEKPEKLLYTTIGMYHCPDCGIMLIAGLKHPQLCKHCMNEEVFNAPERIKRESGKEQAGQH